MATDEPSQPRVFISKFPVYIPCRPVGDGLQPLVYGDGTMQSVLVFTDKQRCIIFGAEHGYSTPMLKGSPATLADYLLEASQSGSDTFWLDPQPGGPAQGVIPIAHAIFRLQSMADPEADHAE
jgi:hypothetical protein